MAHAPQPAAWRDVCGLLTDHARSRPSHPALRRGRETATYRDLVERIDRIAGALCAGGIRRGETVALLAEPSIRYVACFLGAIRAGACAVPLALGSGPGVAARMAADAGARVLFASRLGFEEWGTEARSADRVALDFEAPGWTAFEAFLGEGEEAVPAATPRPGDDFNVLYSSGTTGTPKGIVQSHAMRARHVERMGRLGIDAEAVTLIATPLCSNATWIALLPTLARGGTVVLLPAFDTGRYVEVARADRVTHTMLVPIQVRRLLDEPSFGRADLDAFRATFCTGAHLPVAWKREILARWPGRFVEIYGQTEGGCTTLLDILAHRDKLDTVGRPAPGVEVRILDAHGRPLEAGAPGEIAGRAPGMMSGYRGRADLTEALTWRDEAGRAFYRSGDLGYLDPDGFLHLCGRSKDVIISGGQNVYASDLEDVLHAHEAVAEAAVIGVASPRWGEAPLAVVVRQPGASISGEDLLAWAGARLGRTQRPCGIVFRDALPRNALGKVLKEELRALHGRR